jgi:hypothetical protein
MLRARKIVNLLMAMGLLMGTTGFTLHEHHCMGRIMSVSINHEADPCTEGDWEEPMPCCDDVSYHLQVNDIEQGSFHFDGQPQLLEMATIISFDLDLSVSYQNVQSESILAHSPPLPRTDIQANLQVYLI